MVLVEPHREKICLMTFEKDLMQTHRLHIQKVEGLSCLYSETKALI